MSKSQPLLSTIKVLLAEDDRMMQLLIQDVLQNLGFTEIALASSGRLAIELLDRFPFDLVISDWRMKDMDGIDVIRFLRSDPKARNFRIPVILLTGNTESRYVFTARDAGVNEYIIKPFTAEQLAKRIRNIIENPRSFVETRAYRGPDRRRRMGTVPKGGDRRKQGRKVRQA